MAPKSRASATSRYASAAEFDLVASRVAENVANLLGVDERTLKRWRAGRTRIPWAAYQLLYEHSTYGVSERDSAEHFQRQAIVGERDSLRSRVIELEAELVRISRLVDWGSANDPFISPTDPRSKESLAGTNHAT